MPTQVKPIVCDRQLVARLWSEARQSPRTEVCGFIGARRGAACSAYPVANVAAAPARRFDMDPADQIAAFKQMRARSEDLFAVYHSHPNAPAVPSAEDLAGWTYPAAIYLIVSLARNDSPAIRAWQRAGGSVIERVLADIAAS